MRQRFNERVCAPGEKLGVFAAEVGYLDAKSFTEFSEPTRLVLTKEAFIRGLLPTPLRQQVRLMCLETLNEALEHPPSQWRRLSSKVLRVAQDL